MRRALPVAFALGLGLVLNGCIGGDFGMPFRACVDETRPLAANGELSLENTNGSVHLSAWDEAKVRIEGVKRARSERALEELKVEIVGEYLETKENILIRKEFRATALPRGTGVAYNSPKSR